MTTPAYSISKFIVQNADAPISNLKLQKLLYYAQGWYLGFYGKPLFNERIEAWRHGPVVPRMFHYFREFKWKPVTVDSGPADVSPFVAKHLKSVLKAYGGWSAAQLEMQSHQEAPWKEARGDLAPDETCRKVITTESMQRYFSKLANG